MKRWTLQSKLITYQLWGLLQCVLDHAGARTEPLKLADEQVDLYLWALDSEKQKAETE